MRRSYSLLPPGQPQPSAHSLQGPGLGCTQCWHSLHMFVWNGRAQASNLIGCQLRASPLLVAGVPNSVPLPFFSFGGPVGFLQTWAMYSQLCLPTLGGARPPSLPPGWLWASCFPSLSLSALRLNGGRRIQCPPPGRHQRGHCGEGFLGIRVMVELKACSEPWLAPFGRQEQARQLGLRPPLATSLTPHHLLPPPSRLSSRLCLHPGVGPVSQPSPDPHSQRLGASPLLHPPVSDILGCFLSVFVRGHPSPFSLLEEPWESLGRAWWWWWWGGGQSVELAGLPPLTPSFPGLSDPRCSQFLKVCLACWWTPSSGQLLFPTPWALSRGSLLVV